MLPFLPYPPDEGIGVERKGVGLGSHLTAKGGKLCLAALEPEYRDIHFQALLELGHQLCKAPEMCQWATYITLCKVKPIILSFMLAF